MCPVETAHPVLRHAPDKTAMAQTSGSQVPQATVDTSRVSNVVHYNAFGSGESRTNWLMCHKPEQQV